MGTKGTLAMVRRALRKRWPMADKVKKSVVDEMHEILTDPNADLRCRVRAAEVLVMIDRLNLDDEADQRAQHTADDLAQVRAYLAQTNSVPAEGRTAGAGPGQGANGAQPRPEPLPGPPT